ncbi:HET-domain-containing protein [Thozetella sp. PMI_491]|nr:HET-domain-containing protein [Thozetella sp. PMI_491]
MPSEALWALLELDLESPTAPLIWCTLFTFVIYPPGWVERLDPSANVNLKSSTFGKKVAYIRSWLHDCREHHGNTECKPLPFIPKRLVSVGLDGESVRLVEGSTVGNLAEYATLSYCWGQGLSTRTTKDTLLQYMEDIPFECLPKTFADALAIARGLEIPYLWVDALCIVQDDEADWQREAAQMDKIYQGSQLTIMATNSLDSYQGCFSYNLGAKEDHVISCAGNNGIATGTVIRIYCGDVRQRAMERNRVSSRGWTLQEQVLSPRIAACMEPEVHWLCKGCYCTQHGLKFGPSDIRGLNNHLTLTRLEDPEERRHAWHAIVRDYSNRKLTYGKDRVPSLAGVADYFASAGADDFILGLWKSSFARDLGWLRLSTEPVTTPLPDLPSWSWMSCPFRVSHMGLLYEEEDDKIVDQLKVLNYDVQWAGAPNVSSVKSAWVRIEAAWREIPIRRFAKGDGSNPPYFQVFGENLSLTSTSGVPWRCSGQFDDVERKESATYLCLLLYSKSLREADGQFDESFIIVEPIESSDAVTFRRIGAGRIHGEVRTFDPTDTISLMLV